MLRRGFMVMVIGGSSSSLERDCERSVEVGRDGGAFRVSAHGLREGRRSPSVFGDAASVTVFGGCAGPGRHLSSTEVIHIADFTVNQSECSAAAGNSCAAFCQMSDGSGLVVGGFNETGCLSTVTQIRDGVAHSLPDVSSPLKNSCAIPLTDEKVLLMGGWDGSRTLDTVFVYELGADLNFTARLAYPIEGHSAVKIGNLVYVVGGFDGVSVVPHISVYDVHTKCAQKLGSKLAVARENHACVLIKKDGKDVMLVIGGWDGHRALAECEAFELVPHAPYCKAIPWSEHLQKPRNRPAAIVIHDQSVNLLQ